MVPHKKGCAGLYIINESNTLVLNGHSQKDFFTIDGAQYVGIETNPSKRQEKFEQIRSVKFIETFETKVNISLSEKSAVTEIRFRSQE
jgi:hypothetical protein